MDDVALEKASIIERCLRRVAEEYAGDPKRLKNFTHQDAIILNLERACQAAIDIAMRVVARDHLGIPQSSAQAFDLLAQAGKIAPDLAKKMHAMVGFRNVAVHEYKLLDLNILKQVVEHGHKDLTAFCASLGL
ncbi:DUF86 domain-containing protein, partial [Elusimicrobiota bacterium]